MDKCPYCGADTRPGDNFCLNCGNRLLSATPSSSPQQAQPIGEATLAAPDDWASSLPGASGMGGWPEDSRRTIPEPEADAVTYRAESSAPTAQATIDVIERPARFILHSESGEVLQEFLLDKPEITIGRAPSSDILLSKDKLTSRRHATLYYENGQYLLRDERSANGTFINGQQVEEMVPRPLQDGDKIGIGEHELVFKSYDSVSEEPQAQEPMVDVVDLPTVSVHEDAPFGGLYNQHPYEEKTYRTQQDDMATVPTSDDYETNIMDEEEQAPAQQPQVVAPATPQPVETSAPEELPIAAAPPAPIASSPALNTPQPSRSSSSGSLPYNQSAYGSASESSVSRSTTGAAAAGITFNRLTSLPLPSLPDISALVAALSTLDGQVMSLQEQLNATQDALRNHDSEIARTTNQLRAGIRDVSDRMDSTIADVARSREALSWSELVQLMEDVMNNPRDIEYVIKLARKARELNKVFQIHQSVLNTMAECNSLLRSMIGEDK
ncbi:FHA domain-containing protein [Ktedonosporobacter rubrisoli]|nr:FHA domain-containing protein [Ktedonosporobacter rubrisoli]